MTRMSLFQKLETDLAEARRRSDSIALGSLGLLKSEVVNASKEAGFAGSIDDALVIGTVRKEIKRRQESADAYSSAGRTEAAERELAAAEVLKPYLPAQLGPVIEEVKPSGPAGFGMVMKEASLRLAGRAVGSDIAATAKRLLG